MNDEKFFSLFHLIIIFEDKNLLIRGVKIYLSRSFSSELPWMVCPKGSTELTCIDRKLLMTCYSEDRLDNCYPKLGPELFSTRLYYKLV